MVVAFLFNGSEARASDFDVICEAIFEAVLNDSPEAAFDVRSGGVLLWRFSERTMAVHRTMVAKRLSDGYTISDNKDVRKKLAVALADSVSSQYHHLEPEVLPWTLLRHSVECVTVSELTHTCADAIHIELKQNVAGYMGCFEVDRGDPLALELAANGLIPFCRYLRGILQWIVPFDHDPKLKPDISWAQNLPFSSIELTMNDPERIPAAPLSAVGKRNAHLLETQALPDHAEEVLESLRDSMEKSKDATEFMIEFGKEEFDRPRADVRKLRGYCLNEQHTKKDGTPGDGRGKAFLFRHLLGITRNDWLFLGEQLVAGLEKVLPNKTRKSEHGVQYDVTIPVTGRNGQTKLVKCGWIIRADESPSLTTAYIADHADTTEQGSLSHLIVEAAQGADLWQKLYDVAHQYASKAAGDWIPTPMWIEGETAAIPEGACGFAWVHLPDSRSGFARWLKKQGLGSTGYSSGCSIFAKTSSQSLERAQKYSEAFARVLRLNGIECKVGWRYH